MESPTLPQPRSVYRAMGRTSAWERIGVGIMDKRGVTVDHRDYQPPTWSVIYVLRGRGTYRDAAGTAWPLAPGDCFQRLPDHRHTTELDPTSDWLEAWIDLGPSLSQALMTMQIIRPDPPVWHWGLANERIARITALMRELEHAADHELADLCVRCQALAVEALTAATRTRADDPLERLCRVLAEAAGTRLDLRRLCSRERLDYDWVRKAFRTRFGVSPNQYRIRRRIERACVLLHTTDRSISAIAEDLGYSSAYEFSTQFRQWLGVPPSRYR